MVEKIRIALSRLFVLTLLVIVLTSSSATNEKWPLVGEFLFFMGVVLVAIASMGRLWCSVYIAGYKTDILVMQGPYSLSRNPLYFFSLIGAIGVGLTTHTMLIPALVLIAFAAYYPFVIKSEESILLKRHGTAFSNYLQTVPRFFPKLSGLIEPESYVVRPRVVKRHMVDAIWFIWLIGFLEVIEVLHDLNLIPTLFKIY
jgi:protein-S-isoprenylcysteine O-methyltransferase Ste14